MERMLDSSRCQINNIKIQQEQLGMLPLHNQELMWELVQEQGLLNFIKHKHPHKHHQQTQSAFNPSHKIWFLSKIIRITAQSQQPLHLKNSTQINL